MKGSKKKWSKLVVEFQTEVEFWVKLLCEFDWKRWGYERRARNGKNNNENENDNLKES